MANSRLPTGGARKQKIGDIGAGDEQHQADGAEQDHEGIAYVADDAVAERLNLEPHAWTGLLWVIAMVLSGGNPQLRVGLFQRDAGPEKAGDVEEVVHVVADRRKLERQPDIRFGIADETLSDDADDRVRLIAQEERLSDDVAITGKPVLPQAVAEHHHLAAVGRIFLRGEGSPQDDRSPEETEIALGNVNAIDLLGVIAGEIEAGADKVVGRNFLKTLVCR